MTAVRPGVGEVAAVVALLAAAAAATVAGPPDLTTAGEAAGGVALGAGFLGAAAAVRRGARTGRGTAAAMTLLGLLLLGWAVARASPEVVAAGGLRPGTAAVVLAAAGLVLVFPSGRLDGAADRGAALVTVAGAVALAVAPGPVAVTGVVALVVAVAAAFWLRVERSTGDARRRLLWLAWAVATVFVVGGHLTFLVDGVHSGPLPVVAAVLVVLVGLVLPAALAVALVALGALDVRATISATALGVVMVDLVLAVVAGTLAVVEGLLGHTPPRLLAVVVALVAAVGFGPMQRRVRAVLDQVLFGGRPDPVGLVTTLGGELRRGGDPQSWLDAVRAAVDLPYAALLHGDRPVAVSGVPEGPTATVELRAGPDHVGDLVVGLPEHHPELSPAAAGVLELAAAPLARALQSTRLAEELQRSRERLVLASEEERRRLRRELHDGLGPVLAGVAYTADAARNVLAARPDRASALLAELRDDVAGAVAEVRRLVHDLRPPALDQLGLVPALRQQADRLHRPDGSAVRMGIEADVVGPLPAAVEVAAYRLVSEAMLNVARHADATSAEVRIAMRDGVLELCVRDDAVGGGPWVPGVGLTSMRERVEQLGGRLEAGGTAAGGRVRALVPVG